MSTNRFDNLPDDNTGRLITQDHQNFAVATPLAATINAQKTTLVLATIVEDTTLNLTLGADLQEGDELVVIVSADATGWDLILGTGMFGADLTLGVSFSGVLIGYYDGTQFLMGELMTAAS